jgi:hypothetical protein
MRNFFRNLKIVEVFYFLAAIVIPLQRYFHNHYNNFTIFQHSSFHFFSRTNLYIKYPKEYFDFFLYNPTFAVLFVPFAYLPTLAGIYAWIGFLLVVYYFSIRLLPFSTKEKLFIYGFTFIELVTALENVQTNPLIASIILFAFIYLENEKIFRASLFPNLGFFIKGYGAISGILFILKKPKFRNFLYLFLWFVILLCLPLFYYSPAGLINLYREWKTSLFSELKVNNGISLMGMLISIFKLNVPAIWFQIAGLLFFISTIIVIFFRKNYEQVKAIFLSYILIWVIIFNHDSESATYIIAVTGVAVWYINSSKSLTDKILLTLTFILTVLSSTDIFPDFLYRKFVFPFSLKALGPSLIWLKIQFSLYFPENNILKYAQR